MKNFLFHNIFIAFFTIYFQYHHFSVHNSVFNLTTASYRSIMLKTVIFFGCIKRQKRLPGNGSTGLAKDRGPN